MHQGLQFQISNFAGEKIHVLNQWEWIQVDSIHHSSIIPFHRAYLHTLGTEKEEGFEELSRTQLRHPNISFPKKESTFSIYTGIRAGFWSPFPLLPYKIMRAMKYF